MKRCGNCEHWKRWPNTTKGFGDCFAPVPLSYPQPAPGSAAGLPMTPDDGEKCSLFEAAGKPTARYLLAGARALLLDARAPAKFGGKPEFMNWHDARDGLLDLIDDAIASHGG